MKNIEWLHAQMTQAGYKQSGTVTAVQQGSCSSVYRVPTTAVDLYFKVNHPHLRHEPILTQRLWQWGMPVPAVVAIDADNGYLLMEDGGQLMRPLVKQENSAARWMTAVSQYAQMQIDLIDKQAELLAIGVPDRRLAQLPTLYQSLLDDEKVLQIGQKDGLSHAEADRFEDLLPRFTDLCQQLDAFGIPETLHHDDLHDNNIFVRDGRFIFADWGEANIAHPFFSLLIVLRIAAYVLELEEDDPNLQQIITSYLTPWHPFGSPTELRHAFDLAQQIAPLNRALTWRTLLTTMTPTERLEEAEAVPGWIGEFLEGN